MDSPGWAVKSKRYSHPSECLQRRAPEGWDLAGKDINFCNFSELNTGSPLTQSSGWAEAFPLQHIQGTFQQSMSLLFNAWMIPVSFRHVVKYERVFEVLSILGLSSPKWINPNTLCKLWVFQIHVLKVHKKAEELSPLKACALQGNPII